MKTERGMGKAFMIDLWKIKAHTNIVDIALKLGLEINHNKSRCFRPENHVHGDRTPSLSFQPARGIFKCFGCGIGGDIFDLVRQAKGCNFSEAYCFVTGEKFAPQIAGIDKSINNEEIDYICNFIYRNIPISLSYPCQTCFQLFEDIRLQSNEDFVTRVVKCPACQIKSRLDFRNAVLYEYRRLNNGIS